MSNIPSELTPQAPLQNVVNFADAQAARIPQGERPRAYRVRPAPPNRKSSIRNGRIDMSGGWYCAGMEEGFLEITRLDDQKRAYARKTDDWRDTHAWAHDHFERWTSESAFWRRLCELRARYGGLDYAEISEAWDIVISPDCFDVFGPGPRVAIEDAPWCEQPDGEFSVSA